MSCFTRIRVALPALFILFGCSHPQTSSTPETKPPSDDRLNILLIVADDLGYTDLGATGGEIPTPNIDALAADGLLLTSFYTAPTCSPTRAMLLTGVDNHLAGLGSMHEVIAQNQRGQPGYEGYLNNRVATLAELLTPSGYQTFMAGKWHLGLEDDQSPHARGFQKSFSMLMGGASHFDDMIGPTIDQQTAVYRENGQLIDSLPEGFYSSNYYTDKLLDYLRSADPAKPFFGYLAYTAVHWPLQTPPDEIDRFKGDYDEGYEVLRERRFERLKAAGLIKADAELPELDPNVRPWAELTAEEQAYESRLMEIYAAMIANLDENIGRLIQYLKTNDLYDHTMIVFMSDNGAEGNALKGPLFDDWVAQQDNRFENMGKPGSFLTLGPGWAEASTAPFRYFKAHVTEGGVRSPAIIRLPGAEATAATSSEVVTVKDFVPTVLELADVAHPGREDAPDAPYSPSGRSLAENLTAGGLSPTTAPMQWELFGRAAIRMGDWKAVMDAYSPDAPRWRLYNLANDPAENIDLSETNPDMLEALTRAYADYAMQNGVIPPDTAPSYGAAAAEEK